VARDWIILSEYEAKNIGGMDSSAQEIRQAALSGAAPAQSGAAPAQSGALAAQRKLKLKLHRRR
jgi:hypothetical protein